MFTLRMLPEAKADLQEIWRYSVEQWSQSQAELYIASLEKSCRLLVDNVGLGRVIPGLRPKVYAHHSQQHWILYSVDKQGVIFLAFLHERMEMLRHMSDRLK